MTQQIYSQARYDGWARMGGTMPDRNSRRKREADAKAPHDTQHQPDTKVGGPDGAHWRKLYEPMHNFGALGPKDEVPPHQPRD